MVKVISGPTLDELFEDPRVLKSIPRIVGTGPEHRGHYYHWDKLRHLKPPKGLNHRQWWFAMKFSRRQLGKQIPLKGVSGEPFWYVMVDSVQRLVHLVDRDASGRIEISEQVTNPETRDRYIVNSLIQEAITSSQLEGASTTTERAKDLIRTGRRPINRDEQMIVNNYLAMSRVREFVDKPLTPEILLELQEILTVGTLNDSTAAGRLRTKADEIVVSDTPSGRILHRPPPARELRRRIEKMCEFANADSDSAFVHPVIRAIILHFWLGYDHPFVDGNGRTARALFYWSMVSSGYWLSEYISISKILRSAPSQYAKAFLYTETDENDLTYFIIYQLDVIRRAIDELHEYLKKKVAEVRRVEALMRKSADLNHRQLALLSHALKHPTAQYSIRSHQTSHNVVYETARTDLLGLADRGFLLKKRMGRKHTFSPPPDLTQRLEQIGGSQLMSSP